MDMLGVKRRGEDGEPGQQPLILKLLNKLLSPYFLSHLEFSLSYLFIKVLNHSLTLHTTPPFFSYL
jgi:hypothetical protein